MYEVCNTASDNSIRNENATGFPQHCALLSQRPPLARVTDEIIEHPMQHHSFERSIGILTKLINVMPDESVFDAPVPFHSGCDLLSGYG